MIIVADANIPALEETFGRHGEVRALEGRTLTREQLREAQALVVRSVTEVDENLLSQTPVEFVGTTTIAPLEGPFQVADCFRVGPAVEGARSCRRQVLGGFVAVT